MSCDKMDDLPDLIRPLTDNEEIFDSQSFTDSSILRPSSHRNQFDSTDNNVFSRFQQGDFDETLRQIWEKTTVLNVQNNETFKVEVDVVDGEEKKRSYTPKTVTGLTSEYFPKKLSDCWGFTEMMPLQRAIIVAKDSSPCPGASISTVSNDRLWLASPDNSAVAVQIQREDVKKAPNQNLVDKIQIFGSTSTSAAPVQTSSENYRLLPFHSIHFVGHQAFFVVQTIAYPQGAFPECLSQFKIQLTRPNGSTENLFLFPHQQLHDHGWYICSFCPTETGSHILSAVVNVASSSSGKFSPPSADSLSSCQRQHMQGSPMVINPCRSYADSAGHNFIRMGFNTKKIFCRKPWGIAVYRPKNWIYIADRESNEVIIVDQSPKIIRRFGEKGSLPGQFYRPTGVAVDHIRQRVIISDKDNHRISVFDLKGNFIFNFGQKGHENGDFHYPWGVAVSPNGEIIAVADSRNYRIQLFDADGIFLRKYSVFETRPFHFKEEFHYPRGIAFNLDGSQVYVTDFNIQAVFVLNLDLTKKDIFVQPKLVNRPHGITVDEAGNVLIADSMNNCIRVVSPKGMLMCTLTMSGNEMFDHPLDVAVLRGGKVAVLDKNNRFRIF